MVVAYILSWLNVLGYFCAYQNDVIDANRAFAFSTGQVPPCLPCGRPCFALHVSLSISVSRSFLSSVLDFPGSVPRHWTGHTYWP